MSLPEAAYVTFHPMTVEGREGDVALIFHERPHPSAVGCVPPDGCPSEDCVMAAFVISAENLEDHIEMLRRTHEAGRAGRSR